MNDTLYQVTLIIRSHQDPSALLEAFDAFAADSDDFALDVEADEGGTAITVEVAS